MRYGAKQFDGEFDIAVTLIGFISNINDADDAREFVRIYIAAENNMRADVAPNEILDDRKIYAYLSEEEISVFEDIVNEIAHTLVVEIENGKECGEDVQYEINLLKEVRNGIEKGCESTYGYEAWVKQREKTEEILSKFL